MPKHVLRRQGMFSHILEKYGDANWAEEFRRTRALNALRQTCSESIRREQTIGSRRGLGPD